MIIALTLHILSVVIWVGGMFFAYMALRPAALGLEPPQRLPLWSRTFARFFPWVWATIVILPLTGLWLIRGVGGIDNVGIYVYIMLILAVVMILIFMHIFFAPYRKMNKAIGAGDIPAAGKQLSQIRRLVGINLIIGLVTIIVAVGGKAL
ncbi:MAG TPA: hypothetical protein ENI80_09425 [Acidiferrobacteraceae bacterium]|nr:hypothetical protein [Acidiferrobacteraceae bacterium]